MRKTRIKIKANIAEYINAHKIAWFIVNNWHNKMANSNRKAETISTNVELAKFDIYIIISLTNNIYKTCCNWARDNFTKCSYNNLIKSLIMNIRAEFITHIEESLTIYCCQ